MSATQEVFLTFAVRVKVPKGANMSTVHTHLKEVMNAASSKFEVGAFDPNNEAAVALRKKEVEFV